MNDQSRPFKYEEGVKEVKEVSEERKEREAEEVTEEDDTETEVDDEPYSFSIGNYISRHAMLFFLIIGGVFLFNYLKSIFQSDPDSLWILIIALLSLAIGGVILYFRFRSGKIWK